MEKLNNKSGGVWRIATIVVLTALLSVNAFLFTMIRTDNTAMLTIIRADVKDVDTKLFDHLTNATLHVPREQVVSQAEFDLYKMFKDDEKDEILGKISEMKSDLLNKIDDITVSRR